MSFEKGSITAKDATPIESMASVQECAETHRFQEEDLALEGAHPNGSRNEAAGQDCRGGLYLLSDAIRLEKLIRHDSSPGWPNEALGQCQSNFPLSQPSRQPG